MGKVNIILHSGLKTMWVPKPPHSRGREKWLPGKQTRGPAVHTKHWAAIQGVTIPDISDPLCS